MNESSNEPNVNESNEQMHTEDFPASSPNFFHRIPKPIMMSIGVAFALIFLVMSFPRSKTRPPEIVEKEEKIDDFERMSPASSRDPFSKATQFGGRQSPLKSSTLDGAQYAELEDPEEVIKTPLSATVKEDVPVKAPQIADITPLPSYKSPSVAQERQPPKPYFLPQSIANRLDNGYQSMVSHFKKTSQLAAKPVNEEEYKELLKGDKLNKVDPSLRNLTENSSRRNSLNFTVPSGTRLRAVTLQEVNSDHPGFFTAKVTSPQELSGYKLLCQSRSNSRDRIPVSVNKIISPDGAMETQAPGEVRMKYPGLEGDIKTHIAKRMVPPIMSAFVGAGAGYLYYRHIAVNQNPDSLGQRINTADQVAGPPYQSGVQGIQNEINRFGGDYPNTIKVPEGTEFELLVTDAFTIEI